MNILIIIKEDNEYIGIYDKYDTICEIEVICNIFKIDYRIINLDLLFREEE